MQKFGISIFIAVLFAMLAACSSGGGPVEWQAPLQKPVKSYLVTNPVYAGSPHDSIHNLRKRVTAKQILDEVTEAYPSYKGALVAKFKPYGASSPASSKYKYTDIFDGSGNPIASKMKTLIHDPDKLLVVPVLKVYEKRENIDVDAKFICPGQYRARLQLSYRYIDSRGKLLLDSSQIEFDDAAVQHELHELRRTAKKCGMVYRVNQNFKSMFARSNVSYLKQLNKAPE